MNDFPIMLRIAGERCVVVGGGSVAERRVIALLQAGGEVEIIAPDLTRQITALPITVHQRGYQAGDLRGAKLVVIATDDRAVNEQVARDAKALGVLVNRADDPGAGDFTVPAHARHGPVTLAVHTSGISASAAAAIRREMSQAFDPDWARLLEVVAAFRGVIQERVADAGARQEMLRKLTDESAMGILKEQGAEALRQYCERIAADAQ
jgi:precorrin-2 dehydrogenase/sirohydrochlorin ferrochelatase